MLNMKDTSDKLYRMANQDALTGLWNRRYFFDQGCVVLERPGVHGEFSGNLFEELSNFKLFAFSQGFGSENCVRETLQAF